jgi:hypothetical protein
MDFGVIYQLKTKNYLWVNAVLYGSFALLMGSVICFFIFDAKISSLQDKLTEARKMTASMGTPVQKDLEKKVFDYQKKIDDFAVIIGNHKIPSNVFSLLEKLTLPNVWFYSISINNSAANIQLSGEAETQGTLTQQIAILEGSDLVDTVSNLSSGITESGRIKFNLNLVLNPSAYLANTAGSGQKTSQ